MDRVFVWNKRASSPVGPFDRHVISNLIEKGVVRADTLVAADGDEQWTSASDHPATAFWLAPEVTIGDSTPSRPPATPKTAAKKQEPVRHAAYDPDFDLDLLDLNPSQGRRCLRDYALVAAGLNALAVGGLFMLPMNPVSLTFLITLFVSGNVSLAWIYGVVLR